MARTRSTVQRAAVLSAIRRADHHPDATWVYWQVSRELPAISLGTVYRLLATLCREGEIREYPQAGGPTLYDVNTQDHFHVRCDICHRIFDVPLSALPSDLEERARSASQFDEISTMRIEFFGRCRDCRSNQGF